MRKAISSGLLALVTSIGATASAQSLGGSAPPNLSDTVDALPGIHRIGVAGISAPRGAGAFHLNYGFTEPQNGEADSHHRVGGSLAAGLSLFSAADLAVRMDLRHDMHGSDGLDLGADSGTALDVTPLLRFGGALKNGLHLGAEARLPFYGAAAESGAAPPVLDARALASYLGVRSWAFALHAGYRMGVSDRVAADATLLRPGDRVALGLSEFDAILLGLGALKTFGTTDVFAEWTWDLLIGDGAPAVTESPFRLGAGVRHGFSSAFHLQGLFEVSPLSRPPSTIADPLAPVEPRFQVTLGVVYRFLDPFKPVPEQEKKAEPKPRPAPVPPPAPAPVVIEKSRLRVTVVDHLGHPISDAEVTLVLPESAEGPEREVPVPLVEQNVYEVADVPVGAATLKVRADLLSDYQEPVEVSALAEGEEPVPRAVELKKAEAIKAQLRGLVRSYDGKGLPASITVKPGDLSTVCGADGQFVLDLAPGKYDVTISAEGYRSQERKLTVGKEGVTVLNADLTADTQ